MCVYGKLSTKLLAAQANKDNKDTKFMFTKAGRKLFCILLTAKSRSTRGASCDPAFMNRSLTVSQTRLLCPPCGKMGLQSWTVVVAINKLSN